MAALFRIISLFVEKIFHKKLIYISPRHTGTLGLTAAKSGFGFWYVGNVFDSHDIAYGIAANGEVEREGSALVAYVVKRLTENARRLVLYDVGSNTGYYSILAAYVGQPNVLAFSFDPVKEHVLCERESARLNHLEDKIKVHELALSDNRGEGVVYLSGSGTTLKKEFLGGIETPTRIIQKDTLDNFVATEQLPSPNFIKIDVEGMEYFVLKGARTLLGNAKPIVWYESAEKVETNEFTNEYFYETQKLLTDMGYVLFRCGEKELFEVSEPAPDGVSMWLAVHPLTYGDILKDIKSSYSAIVTKP